MAKQVWNLRQNFFLMPHGTDIVLWDFERHSQYRLDRAHLLRLYEWITQPMEAAQSRLPEDSALKEAQLLQAHAPLTQRWEWDSLSYIFHLGTSDVPESNCPNALCAEKEYLDYCAKISQEAFPTWSILKRNTECIPLPSAQRQDLQMPLAELLHSRITVRNFYDSSMNLQELANLLSYTFGRIHGEWTEMIENNPHNHAYRRSSPSAGGLHTNSAYILCFNVENLERGIYFYDDSKHSLVWVNQLPKDFPLEELLCQQDYGQNISVGFFLVSDFRRTWWKYKHSRAYRGTLLDAGHLSQTLLLAASAMKLYGWPTAAFRDSRVAKLLKLESPHENAMFFVGIGRSKNPGALPRELREAKL